MSELQEWYYAQGGASVGPVSEDEFESLVANGTIRADTLVWQDGMADWLPLARLTSQAGAATPPPQLAMGAAGPVARSDASTFMGALKDGFTRYVDFSTRSNRPQFWFWVLWNFILGIVAAIADAILGFGDTGPLNMLLSLVLLLPSIAVSVRRLHDIGRTGWWYLLIFVPILGWLVLLIFFCTRSQDTPNQWGDVPT